MVEDEEGQEADGAPKGDGEAFWSWLMSRKMPEGTKRSSSGGRRASAKPRKVTIKAHGSTETGTEVDITLVRVKARLSKGEAAFYDRRGAMYAREVLHGYVERVERGDLLIKGCAPERLPRRFERWYYVDEFAANVLQARRGSATLALSDRAWTEAREHVMGIDRLSKADVQRLTKR